MLKAKYTVKKYSVFFVLKVVQAEYNIIMTKPKFKNGLKSLLGGKMFFIRTVIFLVIFLTSAYIGFLTSKKYSNRVQNLREIKNALNNFRTKIKFTYEPIPEIFREISINTAGEVSKIFNIACKNMNDKNAGDAWKEALESSNSDINKEDKEILSNFSKLLGKTDMEGQLSEIELTLSFLDMQIEKAEKDKIKNEKLYRTLGFMTGIGIVIVLI